MTTTRGGRCAVISPHLDDGVFSCGHLLGALPGSVLVTVFAGRPSSKGAVRDWDAASGFRAGDDVIGERRAEDAQACAVLSATPHWLDFVEAQYGEPADQRELIVDIGSVLDAYAASLVVVPLGLYDSDHIAASDAAIAAAARRHLLTFAYEDWPYCHIDGLVEGRTAELRRLGISVEPADLSVPQHDQTKHRAVTCYQSQDQAYRSRGLTDITQTIESEHYWTLGW